MRCVLLFLICVNTLGADPNVVISGWLAHQTNVQTWTADFTQTRSLIALAQPLVSTGQVWFTAPQNFRWELGRDQTIAIRNDDTMLVLYPRLNRAERYAFANNTRSEWKDALALLQSGFPRSRDELEKQFNVISVSETNSPAALQLHLEPRSAGARKLMPRINILLTTNLVLSGTELVFIDGSRMRNDFSNVRTNVDVAGKFDLTVPATFKLVEPMKGSRK
ncbi:MAG TPA: outer membrane lipoprotein carrier protein LolA [Candidatus Kapabacteria bacterium]|nr:outer membrane lipoprotein carrier protein LolA [Candidatus Kapabacteria bacterium]